MTSLREKKGKPPKCRLTYHGTNEAVAFLLLSERPGVHLKRLRVYSPLEPACAFGRSCSVAPGEPSPLPPPSPARSLACQERRRLLSPSLGTDSINKWLDTMGGDAAARAGRRMSPNTRAVFTCVRCASRHGWGWADPPDPKLQQALSVRPMGAPLCSDLLSQPANA